MARAIGVSARKISELETTTTTPRTETSRRLREIERLSAALREIMNENDLAGWLEQTNDAFEGSTPLQLIERGEIDRLWQMVFAVRSGLPM